MYEDGISVMLATPSAARPAWLSQKYPEVLRVREDRVRNLHGGRHNHCLTSPIYREKVQIINAKLAQRYKDHPALIAWHVSNEYGGQCHCELCQDNSANGSRKSTTKTSTNSTERGGHLFGAIRIAIGTRLSLPLLTVNTQ